MYLKRPLSSLDANFAQGNPQKTQGVATSLTAAAWPTSSEANWRTRSRGYRSRGLSDGFGLFGLSSSGSWSLYRREIDAEQALSTKHGCLAGNPNPETLNSYPQRRRLRAASRRTTPGPCWCCSQRYRCVFISLATSPTEHVPRAACTSDPPQCQLKRILVQ